MNHRMLSTTSIFFLPEASATSEISGAEGGPEKCAPAKSYETIKRMVRNGQDTLTSYINNGIHPRVQPFLFLFSDLPTICSMKQCGCFNHHKIAVQMKHVNETILAYVGIRQLFLLLTRFHRFSVCNVDVGLYIFKVHKQA